MPCLTPRRGSGQTPSHSLPPAPRLGSAAPGPLSQGPAVGDRHGTLLALPAPPAATATPCASENGEKPPHHVGDVCMPRPAEEAPPNPQAEERGSDPSARCLCHPQFPLYWFSVPAILKGWMDRVLCQGFAFDIPGFYDDGLLKGKLAILSLTTGGTADMYQKTGASGDFRYFLWPLQHGTLHFCGFKVLAPHISFAPEFASEEERRGMVASWAQRLKTIWKEEPIPCSPPWYFGQ
ncbi:ribosyldihydronicotinamide dehydrogenase [quinone] isoform X2 [Kogia breviceps]|uniref:ribosyldihydronicotinamide dehydrogenase [quinone] isoform X2 n=1 Tax=Kogia breviceps TaxID=27615 RepID=UPI0034D27D7A